MKMFKFTKLINRNSISWLAPLFIAAAVLIFLQYSTNGVFADPDGFYHAKSSQLLKAGELGQEFPWLYFTTWHYDYANQHYLYHWLLTPFNTVQKLPVSIVLFGLVFVATLIFTLKKFNLKYVWFWVFLMLIGSTDFLFRINLVKANAISLALLFLIIALVYHWHNKQGRSSLVGIAILSGAFVWTYGGFVFVPVVLGAYAISVFVSEFLQLRFSNKLIVKTLKACLPFLSSIVGIALGMLLHPHHEHIFSLIYDQLFRTGLGAGSVVPAGNEWLPFNLKWFVESNALILLAWLISFGVYVRSLISSLKTNIKTDPLILWLHLLAIGLIALTLWHRRFVEYMGPFLIFAAAASLSSKVNKINWTGIKTAFQMWQFKVSAILLIGLIATTGYLNLNHVKNDLLAGEPMNKYKAAAEWIASQSEPGELVLTTQWDQFPQLFYWNSKNYYLVGLDPTFMYIYDQEKYWQWRLIADDEPEKWESPEQLKKIITNDLQSKFVFIDKERNLDVYEYLVRHQQEMDIKEIKDFDYDLAVIMLD